MCYIVTMNNQKSKYKMMRVTPETWKLLRVMAAERETTMINLIGGVVKNEVKKQHQK